MIYGKLELVKVKYVLPEVTVFLWTVLPGSANDFLMKPSMRQ